MGVMKAPIFIVGTPRSGTTLIGRILSQQPEIFIGGEMHFFEDIYARRQRLGDPASPAAMQQIFERLATLYGRYNARADQERIDKLFADRDIVQHLTTANRDYRDVLSRFMHLQTCQAGKKRWGNHVPKEVFYVKDILSFYPEAKFIFCVRDIRDFLVSYQNRWRVATPGDSERFERLYHPIITSLLWKATIKQIALAESIIPVGNALTIQYESLVGEPVDTVQRICRFIEEDYDDNLLQVDSHNSSFAVQESGIYTSSVGSRRDQLSQEEQYIAMRLAKKEMQHLGYSTTRVTPQLGQLAKIGLTFPYALWRALDANHVNRGPLLPYLSQRAMAFLPWAQRAANTARHSHRKAR
jgi:hypothetical protein